MEQLPEFLINEKTELNFYPYQNIYKLNEGLYIIKCQKNEFQNLLNNKEIINIITNDLLNKIYIIEQNNFEFICFYFNNNIYDKISYHLCNKNNNFNSNKYESKIKDIQANEPKIRINLNIPDEDISYTEDKLENKAVTLYVKK